MARPPDRSKAKPVLKAVGMTLELMRQRDGNIHYVDGLELMGPDDVHLYADGIRPSAEGYRSLAEAYGRRVMPELGLSP